MVYSQEGAEFIGICNTSYTSAKVPIVAVSCCVSVHFYGFRLLMAESNHAKTRGFVARECAGVPSVHQENPAFPSSKSTGISSTSHTSRKTEFTDTFMQFRGLEFIKV